MTPPVSPELNRLRAAAGLIPIIESGLADGKLSIERAALMASFCEWANHVETDDAEQKRLVTLVAKGLQRLEVRMTAQAIVERDTEIPDSFAPGS